MTPDETRTPDQSEQGSELDDAALDGIDGGLFAPYCAPSAPVPSGLDTC